VRSGASQKGSDPAPAFGAHTSGQAHETFPVRGLDFWLPGLRNGLVRSPSPSPKGRAWAAWVVTHDGQPLGQVISRDPAYAERRAAYLASIASQLRGSPCHATIAAQDVGRQGSSSARKGASLPRQTVGTWNQAAHREDTP